MEASKEEGTSSGIPCIYQTLTQANQCLWPTAVVIKLKAAITAAHCVDGFKKVLLHFGLDSRPNNQSHHYTRSVSKIVVHPKYNVNSLKSVPAAKSPPNDLAILFLDSEIPDEYTPAIITSEKRQIKDKSWVVIAGFGRTKKKSTSIGLLRGTHTRVWAKVPKAKEIVTAHSKRVGPCIGDAGGPLFLINQKPLKVAAVMSRASKNCDGVGVFTDLRKHLPWIDQTVNGWISQLKGSSQPRKKRNRKNPW